MKIPPSLLPKPCLPTIHQYGEARPAATDLAVYHPIALKMIQQVFPEVTPESAPLPYTQAAKLILPELGPDQPLPGRLHRLFRSDIDVVQVDGKISLPEWALYFYRLGKLADKPGAVTTESLALGRGLSDKHYLLENGKDLNLGKKLLAQMFETLNSNRFTVTQPFLADCYDLARRRLEPLHGAVKAMMAAKGYDEISARFPHRQQQSWVRQQLLKLFAKSANMPALVPSDTGTFRLQQLDVKNKDLGGGLSRHHLYLKQLNLNPPAADQPLARQSTRTLKLESTQRLASFRFKSPDSYLITPDQIKANSPSPEGKALFDALANQSEALTLRLQQQGETLSRLYENLDTLVTDGNSFYQAIEPIYEGIKSTLGLQNLRIWVCDVITDEADRPLEVLGLFQPMAEVGPTEGPEEEGPTVALSREGFIAFRNALAERGATEAFLKDYLFQKLIGTLVEECVHAQQHKLAHERSAPCPYPLARMADYRANLPLMNVPEHAARSIMGDNRYYHQQPVEHDAKWIAEATSKAVLVNMKNLSAS